MRWPFRRRNPVTLERAIDRVMSAERGAADLGATAGAEIASGVIGRALAIADGRPSCLSAADMSCLGRDLIQAGESVWALDIAAKGRLLCLPSQNHYVTSENPNPDTWTYTTTLASPSGSVTKPIASAGVLHFRWQTDSGAPWQGVSPLDTSAGRLHAELDTAMSDEASGPRGTLIPAPRATEEETKQVKRTIQGLEGDIALVETTASGWSEGVGAKPAGDWRTIRLGADYPRDLATVRSDAMSAVLSACGIPPSLCWPNGASDSREAFRRFLHGTLLPLLEHLSEEMTLKLETKVTLTAERLGAADIAGRARAAGSLVTAGWSAQEAADVVLLPRPAPRTPEASEAATGDSEPSQGNPAVDAAPEN